MGGAEDRIRGLKDTGLTNLPYHRFAANQIWLEIVALAADLLAWAQTVAFPPTAATRRWSRNDSGCDCSPWQPGSCAAAADTVSDYPPTAPGSTSSSTAGTDSTAPEPGLHRSHHRGQRRTADHSAGSQ